MNEFDMALKGSRDGVRECPDSLFSSLLVCESGELGVQELIRLRDWY